MMKGIAGVLAVFLVQVLPASSFGGAPAARPYGAAVSTPAGATTVLLSSSPRSEQHGRDGWALSAGGKDGDAKKKAKPAAGKSSIPGGMGGWDWGFKSTSKKAASKVKPVSPGAAEAAEIDGIKRKAAAEVKAEQGKGTVAKAVTAAAAKAAEIEARQAEAEEITEVKRRAAEEVKAEQEKAKMDKEAEAAAIKANVIAARKRAEEMAAAARGDVPKKTAVRAAKKPSAKEPSAEAKPTKAKAGPAKAKPAKKPAKIEPVAAATTKAETAKANAAAAKAEAAAVKAAQEKHAEKAKADAAAAKAEAASVRAAQEKRAEDMAAQARGDVPTSAAKKAAAKEATPATKTKDPAKADAKTKDATTADDPKTEATEKAEPEKKAVDKPAVKAGRKNSVSSSSTLVLSKPETIVVVTGATGRVGSLAVRRLLELYPNVLVRAIVNDYSKGSRLLNEEKDKYGIKLEIMSAELGGMRSAAKVVAGASAVVFCASGYAQNLSPIQRLANAVRLTLNPSSVADVEGVRDVALALKATKKLVSKTDAKRAKGSGAKDKENDVEPQPLFPNAPRFVLLSSAAVTRPDWSPEDKALYPLAADVPIVKLNPLNILTVKAEGEKELRAVGIPYTVVRPCGLNDDHPKGRPLFSVGDTAAGRICRDDVADILVRCLGTPEATGKTFEVQSLPGFEKVAASVKTNDKGSIDQALSMLPTDDALEKDANLLKEIRQSSYPVLSQLRPMPLVQRSSEEK